MPPKSILLQDLAGGRNTLEDSSRIKQSEHSTGKNYWANEGILTRRNGSTGVVVQDSAAPFDNTLYSLQGAVNGISVDQLFRTSLASGNAQRLLLAGDTNTSPNTAILFTDNGTTFQWIGYRAGTIATTNGNITIIGTGTSWTSHVEVGDFIKIEGQGMFEVSVVTDNTHIDLTVAPGTTASGLSYASNPPWANNTLLAWVSFDVSGAENVFISDGTNTVHRYDGTDLLLVAPSPAAPKAKHYVKFKNYLFAFGQDRTTMKWSTLRDATSWPTANSQTITVESNPIHGAIEYNDSIIIFCEHGIFRVFGDVFDPSNPTFIVDQLSVPPSFKFYQPRSAVVHKGILKFLTEDGWYGYVGGAEIEKISQIIQPDIDDGMHRQTALTTAENAAYAYVYRDRMLVSYRKNSTFTREIFIQDERNKWWLWENIQATEIIEANLGSGSVLLAGLRGAAGYNNSVLMTLDTGNVDATGLESGPAVTTENIDHEITTKEFLSSREVEFLWARITVRETSTSCPFHFGYSIDNESFTFVDVFTDRSQQSGTSVITLSIPIGAVGKSIRLRLEESATACSNTPLRFSILRAEIEVVPTEGLRE